MSNTSEDKKYKCIYSGKDLTESEFSLDHFLPWSFIGLDDLWNLIPTLKGTNSSKSNKLPNSYINDFIRFQFESLIFVNKNLPEIFEKFFEPYALSLSISKELIAKERAESFSEAYKAVLDPLFLLARNQGFQDGWRYKQSVN